MEKAFLGSQIFRKRSRSFKKGFGFRRGPSLRPWLKGAPEMQLNVDKPNAFLDILLNSEVPDSTGIWPGSSRPAQKSTFGFRESLILSQKHHHFVSSRWMKWTSCFQNSLILSKVQKCFNFCWRMNNKKSYFETPCSVSNNQLFCKMSPLKYAWN